LQNLNMIIKLMIKRLIEMSKQAVSQLGEANCALNGHGHCKRPTNCSLLAAELHTWAGMVVCTSM